MKMKIKNTLAPVATAKGIHHTATVDERWDGPAAVAAMPNEEATLWYCHAWRSSDGDVNAKSTYKFPHHKTKGGPANLSACRNGLARLSGANVPESEKEGIRSHLRAHMADAQESEDTMDPIDRIRAARKKVRASNGSGWYRVTNKTATSAEIFVYDEIGYYGIDAQGFIDELSSFGDLDEITLRINSPGGDVFDALAMLNYLRDLKANITVKIDSLAASAASFLAMAGDTVEMMPSSKMMIHEASGLAWGEARDLRVMADLLDDTSETIAEIYAGRAGGTSSEWREAMKATTYYSAEEAVEVGLADRVADVVKKKPCAEDRVVRLAAVNRMVAIDTTPLEIKKVSRTDTVSKDECEDSIPEFDLSDIFRQSLIGAKEDITDVPWDADEFRLVMEDVRDHAPAVTVKKKVEPVAEPEPVIDLMMIDSACRAVQKERNMR